MYQPSRYLSQMHTTNNMTFTREKTAFWKEKILSQLGAGEAAPTTFPPLNSPLLSVNVTLSFNCVTHTVTHVCPCSE